MIYFEIDYHPKLHTGLAWEQRAGLSSRGLTLRDAALPYADLFRQFDPKADILTVYYRSRGEGDHDFDVLRSWWDEEAFKAILEALED